MTDALMWRIGDAGFTIFGPPNGNPSPETIATLRSKRYNKLIRAAPQMHDVLKALTTGERGKCEYDVSNPCFDNRRTDVVGKHWSGVDACPTCTARALIAELVEKP